MSGWNDADHCVHSAARGWVHTARLPLVMGLAVLLALLGATGVGSTITTSAAQSTPRDIPARRGSSCLPDAHTTTAPPLVRTPGLNAGDAAYVLAVAADPGSVSSSANTAPAWSALSDLLHHIGTAVRAYRNEAASRPTLTSAAYTRIGDLQDLLATRGRERVAAEHHWSFDDPRLGPDVCRMYCDAATSYARALRADPTNPRAEAQLASYGPRYRAATARHCPD